MTLRPLARSLGPLGRANSVTPWWLAGGISASSCVGAYAAKGAASQAASYTNLANPGTYDLTLGVAPTWATGTGWRGNGSAYLNTGIVEGAQSWSYIIRYSLSVDDSSFYAMLSAWSSGARDITIATRWNDGLFYCNHSGQIGVTGSRTGVICDAGQRVYTDGVLRSGTQTVGTSPGVPVYVLARNQSGVGATNQCTSNHYIQAVAIYNITLDAATVAALTTAMNVL